jgi:hypothetical protein
MSNGAIAMAHAEVVSGITSSDLPPILAVSEDDIAAIERQMAESTGFPAQPLKSQFAGESIMYELMRLKSFVLNRIEQLEAFAESAIGRKFPEDRLVGDERLVANDQHLRALKAGLEYVQTEIMVQRDRFDTELEEFRRSLSDTRFKVAHLEQTNVGGKANDLTILLKDAKDALDSSKHEVQHDASAIKVALPRIEESIKNMVDTVTLVNDRQEAVELQQGGILEEVSELQKNLLETREQISRTGADVKNIGPDAAWLEAEMQLLQVGLDDAKTNISLLAETVAKTDIRIAVVEQAAPGYASPARRASPSPLPEAPPSPGRSSSITRLGATESLVARQFSSVIYDEPLLSAVSSVTVARHGSLSVEVPPAHLLFSPSGSLKRDIRPSSVEAPPKLRQTWQPTTSRQVSTVSPPCIAQANNINQMRRTLGTGVPAVNMGQPAFVGSNKHAGTPVRGLKSNMGPSPRSPQGPRAGSLSSQAELSTSPQRAGSVTSRSDLNVNMSQPSGQRAGSLTSLRAPNTMMHRAGSVELGMPAGDGAVRPPPSLVKRGPVASPKVPSPGTFPFSTPRYTAPPAKQPRPVQK